MLTKRSRSGFTLPEILVTVTVIAVLAAVVVPAVTQYASRGDAPSAKADVLQLATAITGFASDVRYYPGTLSQLTTIIAVGGTDGNSVTTHTYTQSDVNKWKGPYTPSTLTGSGFANLAGFQVLVGDAFSFSTSGPQWLQTPIISIAGALLVSPASCPSLFALDAAIDGSTNANAEATTGQIQWTAGTCSAANHTNTGTFTTPMLRLIPAP